MGLTLPNDVINGQPNDAVPVEQNYTFLEQYINSELIHRDGSVGMQAPLLLVGAPTQPLHAATKAYVDAVLPVGTLLIYLGAVAPAGEWALANGASLTVSGYPDLHAVLGFRYGGSGGAFNLPNMRGRVPIGIDEREPGSAGADARFDKEPPLSGGSFTVPIPQHNHPIDHNHVSTSSGVENAEHVHPMGHNHPSTLTSLAGGHTPVATTARRAGGPGSSESLMPSGTTGANDTSTNSVKVTAVPHHQHAVDLAAFAGNTGGRSASHTHPVDIPAFSGPSGTVGVAAAELIPPYVVVAYIVRVR